MATTSKLARVSASSSDVQNLITQTLGELRAAIRAEGQKLFPEGIELISVEVKVVNIGVTLKVAGPKAASLISGARLEPPRTA